MPSTPELALFYSKAHSECESVAHAATRHLGKSYRITRELSETTIDCSTLVSQSHWIGAGVQTPFVAESQRLAVNGLQVGWDELVPGDCIYAYRDRQSSPGGRHNHVALYVGTDRTGEPWAVESLDPSGVHFLPLERVRDAGGIRRFCPNPQILYPPGEWTALAERVPKLGRLGARLTSRGASRTRHSGTDVYLPNRTRVVSPFDGEVVGVFPVRGRPTLLLLANQEGLWTLMAPLELEPLNPGERVTRGQLVGRLVTDRPMACNAIPLQGPAKLHWEIWTESPAATGPAPGLAFEMGPIPKLGRNAPRVALNPIYLVKIGIVGSPVESIEKAQCPGGDNDD